MSLYRKRRQSRQRKVTPLQNRGVNELISELSKDGDKDSSGGFTISVEKAREKLSQFALLNPRFYVLNLLASAVAAGATVVRFQLTADGHRVTHNGQAPRAWELENLWSELIHPSSVSLYELAIAVNAARTLAPVELSVESYSEGGGSHLAIEGERLLVRPAELDDWDHESFTTRLTLRETALKKPLRYVMGSPEQTVLRGYPHLGPATVFLNDRQLTEPIKLGDCAKTAAWTHFAPGAPRLEAQPPSQEWAPDCLLLQASVVDEKFEAVMILAPPEVCRETGMLLICNGVTFRRKALPGYDFVSCVVLASQLRKDLSHTDLAEDEAYRAMIASLGIRADLLVARRLEDPRPIPAEITRSLLLEAPFLIDRLNGRHLSNSARVVDRWRKEAIFAEDILSVEPWRALCAELLALEGTPAREVLETRLLTTLRRAGQSLFHTGQTHKASTYWERIVALGQLLPSAWLDQEAENLLLLYALNGRVVDPAAISDPVAQAALLRLLQRPEEAIDRCPCALTAAETMLAVNCPEPAERLLRQCLAEKDCSSAAETLSDLLAFSDPRDPARRREALQWREQALHWRTAKWANSPSFLLEDLAQLARPVVPFYSWLAYHVRAVRAGGSELNADLVRDLNHGRWAMRAKPLGALALKSAVLSAESAYGPTHVVVEMARARAAHYLREAGQWQEADDLLARGHLIRLLQERWR